MDTKTDESVDPSSGELISTSLLARCLFLIKMKKMTKDVGIQDQRASA
jgi:hypothetical protein